MLKISQKVMLKNIPLKVTCAFLPLLLLFSWNFEKGPTAKDLETRSRGSASLEGVTRVPDSDDFASIPRSDPARDWFHDARGRSFDALSAQTEAQDGKGVGQKVGHYRIPPEVRLMSDNRLRARLSDSMRGRLIRYENDLENALEDDDPGARRYYCWGPQTEPEVVEAFRRVELKAGLVPGQFGVNAFQFVGAGRWNRTATDGNISGGQGAPANLTWSIVPDGTTIPSGDEDPEGPSNLIAWLDGLYPGPTSDDLSERVWFPFFEEAMSDLASQAGLTLTYEPNDDGARFSGFSSGRGVLGVRGDIRISGRDIDGDFNTLGFAFAPDFGDIVLDTTDSFFNQRSSNSIRLVNVLTHEGGHALGLGHVCPINETKLMEPFLSARFRGAQFDETYSLQRQYGDELESLSGFTDNDTVARATPISISPVSESVWDVLSIDDNDDVDFLTFEANSNDRLTVRIVPEVLGQGSYLEGPQNNDGSCSSGAPFNPTQQQDLRLELLAADGVTVLASAGDSPVGEAEEILDFALPDTGSYYLAIRGGFGNTSQLYQLRTQLVPRLPSPEISLLSTRLIAESNSGGNGVPDPGETLQLGVTLANTGEAVARNLEAILSGPAGALFIVPDAGLASLAPGEEAELEFLFSPAGECGDLLSLSLALSAEAGFSDSLEIPLRLGVGSEASLIEEDFAQSTSLPSGWISQVSGAGNPWVIDSAPGVPSGAVALSAGADSFGEAFLLSPPQQLGDSAVVLTFRHAYDLTSRRDGAVLEGSLDGEDWFDILESEAVVTGGGYSDRLFNFLSLGSALRGRNAWTGASSGFITTTIELPAQWSGRSLRLRWRVAHDFSRSGDGWRIDSVSLSGGETFSCDAFRPFLTLEASEGALFEGESDSSVAVALNTPLPLSRPVTLSPLLEGNASPADFESIPVFELPAATVSSSFVLRAVEDELDEGTEQLVIRLPSDQPDFAAGNPGEVTIELREREPMAASVFLAGLSAAFDGSSKEVTVTTEPPGLQVAVTYDGQATAPSDAGNYQVFAEVTDARFTGSATGTLEIAPANASITLENLTTTFQGTPRVVGFSTSPPGLDVVLTYDLSSLPPTDAGVYEVVAIIDEPNFVGSTTADFLIEPAPAAVSIEDRSFLFDGEPKELVIETEPSGLPFDVAFDGLPEPPVEVGEYEVGVEITDPNFVGTAIGTLRIQESYLSWLDDFGITTTAPEFDSDQDGWPNIAEYLYGSLPLSPISAPSLTTELSEQFFTLVPPEALERPDALVRGETSVDLIEWMTSGVLFEEGKFSIPRDQERRFLRLRFDYLAPGKVEVSE